MSIAAFALARREPALLALLATASLFGVFHGTWLGDLSNPVWAGFLFAWLFAIVVWGATGLVGHAERLATLTGEPYGTLILGVEGAEQPLLALTLIVSILTFSIGMTNILQGAVHLMLFLAYLMLLFRN